jgi:hypothetical protein
VLARFTSHNAIWLGVGTSAVLTLIVWLLEPRLANVPHLPDAGADWYYWRLPEPGFWNRASVWGLYAVHQVAMWTLIYRAQFVERLRYQGNGLHRLNWIALGLNGVFGALHIVQTHVWYSGLAEDVSIWSSQYSVILLLVFVLIMENGRRGMAFGKKAPLKEEAVSFIRKYHGYYFAWAAVFTFWYHPAETTFGHLIGFFYLFVLLVQGSLFFTRAHLDRRWTIFLELLVLFHGTTVAVLQGNGLWPMFFFGFAGIFVVTQMHGLGWSRLTRGLVLAAYVLAVVFVYSGRGFNKLDEIVRIPVVDYLLVFALAWLVSGGLWVYRRLRSKRLATAIA